MMIREYRVTKRPRRVPTHPGELLRLDVIPALDLSVSETARQHQGRHQRRHQTRARKAAQEECRAREVDDVVDVETVSRALLTAEVVAGTIDFAVRTK